MNGPDLGDSLYDIYGMVYIPFWQRGYFYTILCVFFLAIVAFCAAYIWKKMSLRRGIVPAWKIALQKLEQISLSSAEDFQAYKKQYFELTAVIKYYLSKHYLIVASGKTDQEFLQAARAGNIPDELLSILEQVLNGAVFVKYANEHKLCIRLAEDVSNVKYIIEQTIPKVGK